MSERNASAQMVWEMRARRSGGGAGVRLATPAERRSAIGVSSADPVAAAAAERLLASAGFRVARQATRIRSGDLMVDHARHEVTRRDRPVRLTPTEFRVLALLVERAGRLVTWADLLAEAWGPEYAESVEYLKPVISRLRRKLQDNARSPRLIETVRGFGYRLRADPG
ncbi:MAG: winged helix-turn-helix transcriptional regulator [Chloroflexi bacterium]|nr:winged helix-turn-helix transcriptional regulator [Chloroflexota bacterium]